MDFKKVLHLSINFIDYNNDKIIRFDITEGLESWGNQIEVEGPDSEWVDSTYTGFLEIITSITPQNKIFAKYRIAIFSLLSLNIGFFVIRLSLKITRIFGIGQIESVDEKPSIILQYIISFIETVPSSIIVFQAILSYVLGAWLLMMFWWQIKRYILQIWPTIEFNMGPKHLNKAMIRRRALAYIASAFVIPLLLQLWL